jgi:hypothetical protein
MFPSAFVVRRGTHILTAPPAQHVRRSVVAFEDFDTARNVSKFIASHSSVSVTWLQDGSLMIGARAATRMPGTVPVNSSQAVAAPEVVPAKPSFITNIFQIDMSEEAAHCAHTQMDIFMARNAEGIDRKRMMVEGFVASTVVPQELAYTKFVLDYYIEKDEIRSLSTIQGQFED